MSSKSRIDLQRCRLTDPGREVHQLRVRVVGYHSDRAMDPSIPKYSALCNSDLGCWSAYSREDSIWPIYVPHRRWRKCGKKLGDSRKALQSLRVHFVRTCSGSRWIAGGGSSGCRGPHLRARSFVELVSGDCRWRYFSIRWCWWSPPHVARSVNHCHSGQWIELARCQCVSAIGNQRGCGDRGCAGEPEPATKRVNQIILNSQI